MSLYVFYNPNPRGIKVGDCVIRGLTKLLHLSWDEVYTEVMLKGFEMKDMPSANNVLGAYLRSKGFARFGISNTCPDCYTVKQFCLDNPNGSFLLATGERTWDLTDEEETIRILHMVITTILWIVVTVVIVLEIE